MSDAVATKCCTKCNEVKPIDRFPLKTGKKASGRGWRKSHCITCEHRRKRASPYGAQYFKDYIKRYNSRDYVLANQRQSTAERRRLYEEGKIKIPDTKKCSRCKKVKPSDQFAKSFSGPDCLAYWCYPCCYERKAELKAARNAHQP